MTSILNKRRRMVRIDESDPDQGMVLKEYPPMINSHLEEPKYDSDQFYLANVGAEKVMLLYRKAYERMIEESTKAIRVKFTCEIRKFCVHCREKGIHDCQC